MISTVTISNIQCPIVNSLVLASRFFTNLDDTLSTVFCNLLASEPKINFIFLSLIKSVMKVPMCDNSQHTISFAMFLCVDDVSWINSINFVLLCSNLFAVTFFVVHGVSNSGVDVLGGNNINHVVTSIFGSNSYEWVSWK